MSRIVQTSLEVVYSHMKRTQVSSLNPRKIPAQAHSAATVDAILQAATQVLISSGFEKMSTTRIAERACNNQATNRPRPDRAPAGVGQGAARTVDVDGPTERETSGRGAIRHAHQGSLNKLRLKGLAEVSLQEDASGAVLASM